MQEIFYAKRQEVRQCSDYLGDDLGDVFQRLFDGVFGHVPLKPGDISDQVDCKGEKKSSTLSSSISTDPYVWITHLMIHNLLCFCFFLLCVSFFFFLPAAKEWDDRRRLPPLASRFSWTLSRLSSRTSAMYWATFFTTLAHKAGQGELCFVIDQDMRSNIKLKNYPSTKVSSLASSSERPTKTSSVPTCLGQKHTRVLMTEATHGRICHREGFLTLVSPWDQECWTCCWWTGCWCAWWPPSACPRSADMSSLPERRSARIPSWPLVRGWVHLLRSHCGTKSSVAAVGACCRKKEKFSFL